MPEPIFEHLRLNARFANASRVRREALGRLRRAPGAACDTNPFID